MEPALAVVEPALAALAHKDFAGVPAEKRGNSFSDFMLRKSKAFAYTKGGESRFSPFVTPIA